jgi:hypothetical protein
MAARKRKLKYAIVYWHDAYSAEEADDQDSALQVSVGLLISRTKRHVKLAQIADAGADTEPWRVVLTIPAGMVHAIMVLPVPAFDSELFGANSPKRANDAGAAVLPLESAGE